MVEIGTRKRFPFNNSPQVHRKALKKVWMSSKVGRCAGGCHRSINKLEVAAGSKLNRKILLSYIPRIRTRYRQSGMPTKAQHHKPRAELDMGFEAR
jgi:hypothetical protein